MEHMKLQHVDRFVDRHGKPRNYFRANRGPRVRLPGEPGTEAFRQAYDELLRRHLDGSRAGAAAGGAYDGSAGDVGERA